MKQNLGSIDRIVRVLIALLIIVSYFTNQIEGISANILLGLAGTLLLTSIIGWCPLYVTIGLTTQKK